MKISQQSIFFVQIGFFCDESQNTNFWHLNILHDFFLLKLQVCLVILNTKNKTWSDSFLQGGASFANSACQLLLVHVASVAQTSSDNSDHGMGPFGPRFSCHPWPLIHEPSRKDPSNQSSPSIQSTYSLEPFHPHLWWHFSRFFSLDCADQAFSVLVAKHDTGPTRPTFLLRSPLIVRLANSHHVVHLLPSSYQDQAMPAGQRLIPALSPLYFWHLHPGLKRFKKDEETWRQ